MTSEPDEREVLTGGNVAASVVRVGDTVRKPVTASAPGVEALLRHLTEAGYPASPRPLGTVDGEQLLEYVPGRMADTLPPFSLPDLRRVGGLIRQLHDLSESFNPPDGFEWPTVLLPAPAEEGGGLVCHHDLAPWNLVVDGDRWVFIDWDGAGPGTRLWDLAYAAHGFVPLHPGGDPDHDAERLRALVDGYGLDEAGRRALPDRITGHTRAMYELLRDSARTGDQPWARLWAEGHGDHWGPAADYVETHRSRWLDALMD